MKNFFSDQNIFINFDTPMQKLMNLNVQMMRDWAYMKPMDLFSAKKPDEFFEKQIELFAKNSNMILEYMKNTFDVLQSHWFRVSHDFDRSQQEIIREPFISGKQNVKKSVSNVKVTGQKTTPASKKSASTAQKSAASTVNKSSTPTAKSTIKSELDTKKKNAKNTASTPTKSTIVHAKQSIDQGRANVPINKNKSNEGYVAEKSTTQDLTI